MSEAAIEVAQPAARPRAASVARAFSIEDLRRRARRRLPRSIFEFFDGGAEDEATLRANMRAFEIVRFAPKVLVDVARIDTSCNILGAPARLPIAIAPTGAVGFGWPQGDVAIARAAAAYGIPYSLSTSATASIERIAEAAAAGRLWFQAYIFKHREFTMRLIERARMASYEALMITVDLPVGGKRERDFRNGLTIPFSISPRNFPGFASRPLWAWTMLTHGPRMENLIGYTLEKVSASGLVSIAGRNYDPSFDWDGLKAIRDAWPRKLIVKGILRVEDAERLAGMGCDAVVVSNHGGRQLDGAIATLDALPAIVDAVGSRLSVMMDGGVRRGAHVVKALALGAQAVLIGRATLYGVCAAGEAGAVRALEILRDELVRTMQLCGVRSVAEITRDLVQP
jgi:(S)-mandelate dehydrogenase